MQISLCLKFAERSGSWSFHAYCQPIWSPGNVMSVMAPSVWMGMGRVMVVSRCCFLWFFPTEISWVIMTLWMFVLFITKSDNRLLYFRYRCLVQWKMSSSNICGSCKWIVFQALILQSMDILDLRQPGLMRWNLVWTIFVVHDWSLDLLTCSPALYRWVTAAPTSWDRIRPVFQT